MKLFCLVETFTLDLTLRMAKIMTSKNTVNGIAMKTNSVKTENMDFVA
jgi:hypothetical protein